MMSSKCRKFSSLRLLLLLILNGVLSLLFVNGATPSADELAAKKFMEHRVWECERNGAKCMRLFPAYRDDNCGFPAKAYNCRQGWYEALNGTCLSMPSHCHYVSKGNRELTECLGCSLEDKPSGGKTMLGCVEQEATCIRDHRDGIICEEHQKRHICAKGYYRTPDNMCRENQAVQVDKSYAKPGCEEFFKHTCPPNSEPKCITGDAGHVDYCLNIGELHEPAQLRSILVVPARNLTRCHYTCPCKAGYLLERLGKLSPCISLQECQQKKKMQCSGANEEYQECPYQEDYECTKLSNLCTDCFPPVEMPKPKECRKNQHCNCVGKPGCQCKYGFVRLNGRCVTISECKKSREQDAPRFGGVLAANRIDQCRRGEVRI